ncbi:MAG: hypothetical protein EBT96_12435 [Betaproteobacteria bacterium]|nr:hypothetical protein [Betaproteobacteria bacterium]
MKDLLKRKTILTKHLKTVAKNFSNLDLMQRTLHSMKRKQPSSLKKLVKLLHVFKTCHLTHAHDVKLNLLLLRQN